MLWSPEGEDGLPPYDLSGRALETGVHGLPTYGPPGRALETRGRRLPTYDLSGRALEPGGLHVRRRGPWPHVLLHKCCGISRFWAEYSPTPRDVVGSVQSQPNSLGARLVATRSGDIAT